jgi:hypothetical protein
LTNRQIKDIVPKAWAAAKKADATRKAATTFTTLLRPEVAEQVKKFEADTPLGRMATVDELVRPRWRAIVTSAGVRHDDALTRVQLFLRLLERCNVARRSLPRRGASQEWLNKATQKMLRSIRRFCQVASVSRVLTSPLHL